MIQHKYNIWYNTKMEHQKNNKLIMVDTVNQPSKFRIRNQVEINDESQEHKIMIMKIIIITSKLKRQ